MTDIITVRGYVATDVRLTLAQSGLPITGFRMCSTERRFDREANTWVDGHTNWYSVSMFRQLATNAGASIRKGDRVIVTGRLRVRPWSSPDGRTGTSVEIDADTAGHDLMWGTANFRRTAADRGETPAGAGLDGQPADGPVEDGLPERVDGSTGEVYDAAFDAADDPAPGGGTDTSADEQPGRTRDVGLDAEAVPF